jgi:hypothetical protein
MKIIIGGEIFATKAKAKEYVVNLTKKYIGGRVDESSPDFGVFSDLWTRSPSFEEGPCHFEVGKRFTSVAIKTVLREPVNRVIDWSLRSAVSGRFPSQHTQLTLAMRLAIRPQIQAFKYNNRQCAQCYVYNDIQIDHVTSFKDLMRAFIDKECPPTFYYFSPSGWAFCPEHVDYENKWTEFHLTKARLRPLCADCHKDVTQFARRQEMKSRNSSDSETERLTTRMSGVALVGEDR